MTGRLDYLLKNEFAEKNIHMLLENVPSVSVLTEQPDRVNGYLTVDQIRELSWSFFTSHKEQESFAIKELAIAGERAAAIMEVTESYWFPLKDASSGGEPSDHFPFHLTFYTATRMIGQLMALHGHSFFGQKRNCIPMWNRSSTTEHHRPVTEFRNIRMECQLKDVHQAKRKPGLFGLTWDFNFENSAITGNAVTYYDLSALLAPMN